MAGEVVQDTLQVLDGVCDVVGEVVSFVKEWVGASGELPSQVGELVATITTIENSLRGTRNGICAEFEANPGGALQIPNEMSMVVLKKIHDEIANAKAVLIKYKTKSNKWRFNPASHVVAVSECNKKLKDNFTLYAQARQLSEGTSGDPSFMIEDHIAKQFWITKFGNPITITYITFAMAFKREYCLSEAAAQHLLADGPPVISVHNFNQVISKHGLKAVIAMCEYTNPFADDTRKVNEKQSNKPPVHTNYFGRSCTWDGPPPLASSEELRTFIIWCDKGGALQPQHGETQPGTHLCIAPYKKGDLAQLWKFDKFGCVYNMLSGLVLDMDRNPHDGVQDVILWTRHAGPNQQWKLLLDGTLRAKLYRSVKCMQVYPGDSGNQVVMGLIPNPLSPSCLWRVSNDDFVGDSSAIGITPKSLTAPQLPTTTTSTPATPTPTTSSSTTTRSS
ncbi:hypothetical protein Pelo_7419 [Pelomyxa schiedti]|nr:hypothetical protein Pelo_7419 [Pelomyxa schiedti]